MAKRVCGFFPALYAYNAYDKIEYKLPLTDTAAEIATSPLFDELTSELLVKFDDTKLPKFYLFHDKIEQLEGFREVVYKHRNDVKIGHLEFKKEGSLKHVGINDTDMPAIVTIVEGAKYSEKLLDAQKLDDFLTSFVNKTIKPFELSEDVIEDSDEVLKQNKISRKMYKTGDYKHSLLFFVSKNCGHCKNLKPVIKELIKENRSKVKVCVVDATKNDFSEFVIRGYPTIAYAEDGNIKYFEGERTVAKFVDFVKKNSKDGIDMLSEEEGHADL